MQDVNKIIEYYENLDTTDFPEVQPKLIAELRNQKAEFQKNYQAFGLEQDVAQWLMLQNDDTKQAVNNFIKTLIQAQNIAKQNYAITN